MTQKEFEAIVTKFFGDDYSITFYSTNDSLGFRIGMFYGCRKEYSIMMKDSVILNELRVDMESIPNELLKAYNIASAKIITEGVRSVLCLNCGAPVRKKSAEIFGQYCAHCWNEMHMKGEDK